MVCKICVSQKGYRLANKESSFGVDNELYDHVENEHGIPVRRDGETRKQAKKRCREKGITNNKDTCQCGDCKRLREGKNV